MQARAGLAVAEPASEWRKSVDRAEEHVGARGEEHVVRLLQRIVKFDARCVDAARLLLLVIRTVRRVESSACGSQGLAHMRLWDAIWPTRKHGEHICRQTLRGRN